MINDSRALLLMYLLTYLHMYLMTVSGIRGTYTYDLIIISYYIHYNDPRLCPFFLYNPFFFFLLLLLLSVCPRAIIVPPKELLPSSGCSSNMIYPRYDLSYSFSRGGAGSFRCLACVCLAWLCRSPFFFFSLPVRSGPD
jgi:hypothetical protein